MDKTKVAIARSPNSPNDKEIEATVRKAIRLAGGLPSKIDRGDTVIIKPNIVLPKPPGHIANTDPRICATIAGIVKEKGAYPIIAESSGVGFDTEESIQKSGYAKLREAGYEVIDLKKKGIELVKIPVPKGKKLKEVDLPKVLVEAKAIISVPKMKTHDQPLTTLSLKNMKGILTDATKRKFHTTFGIFQGVADLMTVAKPDMAVVDGIIAMEGLGPVFGDPVEMDLIIAGDDLVAVDAVTCAVMGIEPVEDGDVRVAAESGIGIADLKQIEVIGETISDVGRRFKLAVEAIAEKVPFPKGFELVFSEKACTGCRNCVMSVLVDLQDTGHMDKAEGWTVLAGKLEGIPDVPKEKLLLVGACTAKYKDRGVYVEGCTPNNRDIASAIVGELQEGHYE